MATAVRTCYVVECFWAGLQEEDLPGIARRVEASVATVVGDGGSVRYLGWLFVADDEVVLILLEGPRGSVHQVAEHAGLPFGRILRVARAMATEPAANEEARQ